MAEKYPLIRIPTQSARMRVTDLNVFFAFSGGFFLGAVVGKHFGVVGAIIGAGAGAVLGIVVGIIPNHLFQEHMFREMQRSSNEELRAKLQSPRWTFYETLALLNLQLRDEEVGSYLPRIITLLEADDSLARLFARDALRLVFTPLAVKLDELGYKPNSPTQDCADKVRKLRENLA